MGKRDWLALLFTRNRHYIYHSPNLRRRLFLLVLDLVKLNTFSLVIHGASLENQYGSANSIIRALIRIMLLRAKSIQVVNPAIGSWLQNEMGLPPGKIEVITSFLPPPPEDEIRILESYDAATRSFLLSRSPLIIANAHSLSFHDGMDLYGLDLCLKLVAELKTSLSNNVGLLFALAQTGDEEYFQRMRGLCRTLGIEGNVHFLTGQKEIWPLFKRAQLMVRPTCTDGFGISVAEAIHFGCPAVASDVCRRPEGTVLFESRNFPDFLAKASGILMERQHRYDVHPETHIR